MYENGRGVGKDNREAVRWYRKAASRETAQYNLGVVLQRPGSGEGSGRRLVQAAQTTWVMYAKGRGVVEG